MRVQRHQGGGRRRSWGERVSSARLDIREGLARWQLWSALGWYDLRKRYRRSILGPFWTTISMSVFIAGLAMLYGGLLGHDLVDYLPHLATGLILWMLISGMILDGCKVFIVSGGAIRLIRAPISLHYFHAVWRNLLQFGHYVLILPLFLAFVGYRPSASAFAAAPGLFILVLTVAGSALALGVICARFRDVPPIVAMCVRVLFFFTPIIWKAEDVTSRGAFVYLNPFYYLLEIVRGPLLGQLPQVHVWAVAIGLCVICCAAGLAVYARFRHRLAFWV